MTRKLKGQHWLPLFLGIVLKLLPGEVMGASAYVELDSFSRSAPVSIATALNGWHGEFHGGDRQYSYNRFEAGGKVGVWSIGFQRRFDFVTTFSPDTAEYYYRSQNHLDNDRDKSYQLSLDALRFSTRGVRIAHAWKTSQDNQIILGLSLFSASQYIEGNIHGTDRKAQLSYQYTQDELFDREIAEPQGKGASLDVSFVWQLNERFSLDGEVIDWLGLIRWKHLPYTDVTAQKDRVHENAQGYVTLDPLISGYEGLKSRYDQTLRSRTNINVSFLFKPGTSLVLQVRENQVETLIGGGLQRTHKGVQYGLVYTPNVQLLELIVQRGHWRISVVADHLTRSNINSFGFRLSTALGH